MKKILISYFTGTGNTLRAVNIVKAGLEAESIKVDMIRVEKGVLMPVGVYDGFIFAFPILAFSPPAVFIDYIKSAYNSNKSAFIMSVNGALVKNKKIIPGYSAYAPYYIKKILVKKGYDVLSVGNFSYPDNWAQFTNPPDSIECSLIYNDTDKKIAVYANDLIAGDRKFQKPRFAEYAFFRLFIFLYKTFIGRVLGKLFIADKKCNACGICVKACPKKTIKMSGKKPVWLAGCDACNRCINICPQTAIQTSVLRIFFHGFIGLSVCFYTVKEIIKYLPSFLPGQNEFLYIFLNIILSAAAVVILTVIQLTVFDYLLTMLEKTSLFRPLFEFTFTRKFRRYMDSGFKL